ncbi:hypothetical protein AGMMS49546_15180 [Spirochaetia bacterium]|nr:hypothetical protein AGMMS49546_15180 [Spirochaetia bacterium]
MENFGIICGVTLGLFGSVFSVVQFFYQRHKDKKQDLKDRLFFLAQLIVDRDIPRESRQIFFDEYIAKGGNGSFVKWWLEGK